MKKVATTVYLDRDQDVKLKQLSARSSRSMASLIREGIDLAIERHKDLLPMNCPRCGHDPGGPRGG